MTGPERVARLMELETLVQELVDLGWTLEQLCTEDSRDEPFRVTITLSVEGESELGGML